MQGSATPGGVEINALRAKIVYLFRHLVGVFVGGASEKPKARRAAMWLTSGKSPARESQPGVQCVNYGVRRETNYNSQSLPDNEMEILN